MALLNTDRNRPGDPSRVRALEHLTAQEIGERLAMPGVTQREGKISQGRTLDALNAIAQSHDTFLGYSGEKDKIDSGTEAVRAATLLTTPGRFFQLALWRTEILPQDIEAYKRELPSRLPAAIHLDQAFSEQQLKSVDPRFVSWYLSLTVGDPTPDLKDLPALRSLKVFQGLAGSIRDRLPQVEANRRLTVLYPGAGHHLAPLVTAIQLIDENVIDQADFTYTEIDGSNVAKIIPLLEKAQQAWVIDRFAVGPRLPYPPGFEQTVTIFYRGKPIRITYAINRSGTEYYQAESLKVADLVVIHDPGTGQLHQGIDLFSRILLDERAFSPPEHERLLVMEWQSTANEDELDLPAGVDQQRIDEPYGHCSGLSRSAEEETDRDTLVEVVGCYNTGRLIRLTDPVLLGFASEFFELAEDSKALSCQFDPYDISCQAVANEAFIFSNFLPLPADN